MPLAIIHLSFWLGKACSRAPRVMNIHMVKSQPCQWHRHKNFQWRFPCWVAGEWQRRGDFINCAVTPLPILLKRKPRLGDGAWLVSSCLLASSVTPRSPILLYSSSCCPGHAQYGSHCKWHVSHRPSPRRHCHPSARNLSLHTGHLAISSCPSSSAQVPTRAHLDSGNSFGWSPSLHTCLSEEQFFFFF